MRPYFITISLIFSMVLSLQQVHAQKIFGKSPSQVSVTTVMETSNKAVYRFKAGGQKAQLTLQKSGPKVSIKIENQACTLGLGTATSQNGSIKLNAKDLHKGTLGIWVFAAERIVSQAGQAALNPKQRASNKCRDYCHNKFSQPVTVAFAIAAIGHGREDPPVCVPMSFMATFVMDWEQYNSCYDTCMEKAAEAYKNRKKNK
ncbi:MAG: hypothetical protein AAFR87_30865 [Bacteroidota bacterium]